MKNYKRIGIILEIISSIIIIFGDYKIKSITEPTEFI